MAIRAVRIDGAHTAGVSAESFDAEIKHQVPVTSVHSEKPIAGVHHLKSTAAGIWLDPDTKNQMPKDNVPLDDIYFTVITKPLYDDAELLDVFASAFNAPKEDVFNFVDTFSKVVEYKREFTDGFTLDDLASVNKDFFGDKSNITRVEDIYQTVFNKPLPGDSLGFTENFKRVLHYLRNFNDNGYIFEDEALYAVVKNIQDFTGSLEEVIASEFKKDLNTDTLSTESLTTLQATLGKADDFNFSDTDSYSTTLSKSDDFSYTDESITTFTKTLADAFALDDLAQIGKDFYGDKGNVFAFEDVFQRSVVYQRIFSADTFEFTDGETVDTVLGKSDPVLMGDSLDKDTTYNKADNYTFTDIHQTVTTLPKADTTYVDDEIGKGVSQSKADGYTLGDNSTLQPSLAKSDSFSYTDNQSNTLHKLLQHSFTLDDATTVNKDYYGSKGNVFGMSEEFSRNVQYSRSFPTITPLAFHPIGAEFQVSDYTLKAYSDQENSEVISLIGGGFVVVWQSNYQDHQNAIYAKQYDVNGTEVTPPNPLANNAAGNEFRVNSQKYSTQEFPSATALPDGGFVITWQSANNGQDGDGYGIYAKRYNSNGVEIVPPVALLNTGGALGNEFLVNTYTLNHQDRPDITALADGGFVITWTSNSPVGGIDSNTGQDGSYSGVYAQRYSVDGSTNGDEFQVNTQIDGVQRNPSVATLTGGDFIVIWEGSVPDTVDLAVYAQRFNTNGTPVGPEFVANTNTNYGIKYDADITALNDGGFVVTWDSYPGQDGSGSGIFAQQYNADGSLYGDEFQVNTYTTNSQGSPKVSPVVTQGGGFIITWESYEQDTDGYGVYAQKYNADGSPYGTEIRVNTHITSHQRYPSVAVLSNGNVVVAWQSENQVGTSYGVYAQRYYIPSLDNDDFTLSDELDNLLSKTLEDGLLSIDDTLDNKLNKEILSDTIGFIEDVVIEKIAAGVQRMVNSSTINSHMIG